MANAFLACAHQVRRAREYCSEALFQLKCAPLLYKVQYRPPFEKNSALRNVG